MGIKALLPFLSTIIHKTPLANFRNKRVAIDGYAILHRVATRNAKRLLLQHDTAFLVQGVMEFVTFFKTQGIIPLFVFDGATLPAKMKTEEARQLKRQQALENAKQLDKEGKDTMALSFYKKAIDITPKMAFDVINELRRSNVEYVVAPYEADAELAYLSRTGYVDLVVCEDSDLIPYGSTAILFKMNVGEGVADLYKAADLPLSPFGSNVSLFLVQIVCVVAGCDYFEGIEGIGMKKGLEMLKKCKTEKDAVFEIKKKKKMSGDEALQVQQKIREALFTFNHQYVYDIEDKLIVNLTEIEASERTLFDDTTIEKVLGKKFSNDIGKKIAIGSIDPNTLEIFGDIKSTGNTPKKATVETQTRNIAMLLQRVKEKQNEEVDEKGCTNEEENVNEKVEANVLDGDFLVEEEKKDDTYKSMLNSVLIDGDPFENVDEFVLENEELINTRKREPTDPVTTSNFIGNEKLSIDSFQPLRKYD
ncbi:exodeoxyribonuclease, putative [Entamoeba invadens IP1]|uniref:exodeoxyribonuclease, putative n=1 Tax=Entamoeba invadens IP1 TaxID=370355 RepID=UPI0002C3F2BA|nr:exodeoxyribonuclease, putative [Entamoeba invadens IP1]ELP85233.1 exodeoxyribonuclease, putative [Entamoeba invadens IP1]|eukprot:XP_004184579.1 exodeoxyribonuclease, putative [Entamoeba invadens IP1]